MSATERLQKLPLTSRQRLDILHRIENGTLLPIYWHELTDMELAEALLRIQGSPVEFELQTIK